MIEANQKGMLVLILVVLIVLVVNLFVLFEYREQTYQIQFKDLEYIVKYDASREYWINTIIKCARKDNPRCNLYYTDLCAKALYDFGYEICGQPINLSIAILNIESDWKFNAESHKGAQGVAQIMYKTGEIIAKGLGYDYYKKWMLRHPTHSARFHSKLIWWLRKKYNDDPILYLTAYGCGESKTDSLLKKHGHIPHEYKKKYYYIVAKELKKVNKQIKYMQKERERRLGDLILDLK